MKFWFNFNTTVSHTASSPSHNGRDVATSATVATIQRWLQWCVASTPPPVSRTASSLAATVATIPRWLQWCSSCNVAAKSFGRCRTASDILLSNWPGASRRSNSRDRHNAATAVTIQRPLRPLQCCSSCNVRHGRLLWQGWDGRCDARDRHQKRANSHIDHHAKAIGHDGRCNCCNSYNPPGAMAGGRNGIGMMGCGVWR